LLLRLFALRDELHDLKVRGGASYAEQQFIALNESLSALISSLERFDIAMLAAVEREVRRNPVLRSRAEAHASLLDASETPVVQDIWRRSLHLAATAVAVNSGGWCVFVVPLALARLGLRTVRRALRASVVLSGAELDHLVGTASTATPSYR
jgi:hypothetical protein